MNKIIMAIGLLFTLPIILLIAFCGLEVIQSSQDVSIIILKILCIVGAVTVALVILIDSALVITFNPSNQTE
jgi:hypothetical protein